MLGALLRLLQGVEASQPSASLPEATGGAAALGGSEAAEAEAAEAAAAAEAEAAAAAGAEAAAAAAEAAGAEATAEETEALEGARAAWALLHHCISRLDGLRLSLQQEGEATADGGAFAYLLERAGALRRAARWAAP